MTDQLIMKMWTRDGVFAKYYRRKNNTAYLVFSDGERKEVTLDTLHSAATFKQHGGNYYINVDVYKRVTGAEFI